MVRNSGNETIEEAAEKLKEKWKKREGEEEAMNLRRKTKQTIVMGSLHDSKLSIHIRNTFRGKRYDLFSNEIRFGSCVLIAFALLLSSVRPVKKATLSHAFSSPTSLFQLLSQFSIWLRFFSPVDTCNFFPLWLRLCVSRRNAKHVTSFALWN